MVSFLHHTFAVTFDLTRILDALEQSFRSREGNAEKFDWLAYYSTITEWKRARQEERLLRWFYINYEFQTFNPSLHSLADFVARIRALREKMWRSLSRTSMSEGRHKSQLASIPTPPTSILAGQEIGCPIH